MVPILQMRKQLHSRCSFYNHNDLWVEHSDAPDSKALTPNHSLSVTENLLDLKRTIHIRNILKGSMYSVNVG